MIEHGQQFGVDRNPESVLEHRDVDPEVTGRGSEKTLIRLQKYNLNIVGDVITLVDILGLERWYSRDIIWNIQRVRRINQFLLEK